MLTALIRMPQMIGIPIDRRMTIYTGDNAPPRGFGDVHWPSIPLFQPSITVGSAIVQDPGTLFKAVHFSRTGDYAFETVFAMSSGQAVCLYTKIINTFSSEIAISLKGINQYNGGMYQVLPLTNFIKPSFNSHLVQTDTQLVKLNPLDDVVPAVFGQSQLLRFVDTLLASSKSGFINYHTAWMFSPIQQHVPQILEALIHGVFFKSPFYELSERMPGFTLPEHRWYRYELLEYAHDAKGINLQINHPDFDQVALEMMVMFPADFSVSCLIEHAIDHVTDLWLVRAYHDVYGPVLRGKYTDLPTKEIATLLSNCVMLYCKMFNIDYNSFIHSPFDTASITLTKTIHDEIEVFIRDPLHNRETCFYTCFPAIALSTLAVGWYT